MKLEMNTNLRKIEDDQDNSEIAKHIGQSVEDDGWFEEIKWSIERFLKDAWIFIRHSIPHGITNLIQWLKPIWNIRYWDWAYILMIERRQLELMLKRYEKYDLFENQDYMVSKLKLLIKLIDMIENSAELDENSLVNVGNWRRFIKSDLFDPDKWHWRVGLREEKIWNLYHKVRCNYMRLIWD